MNDRAKVCIKCRTGGKLINIRAHDNGSEVGVIYFCKHCFDILCRSTLDIFVDPVYDNGELAEAQFLIRSILN